MTTAENPQSNYFNRLAEMELALDIERKLNLVQVDFQELMAAYAVWKKLRKAPSNGNTMRAYLRFLGVNEEALHDVYASKEIQHGAVEKIKWLNSPNATTLYKAWKIRHDRR